MAGRYPSLVKTSEIDIAKRKHSCQRCSASVLKGEHRLAITVERDVRHYCAACASATLDAAEKRLAELRASLRHGKP
jgi:late competence protein required for DNA uptake (superfamily II DNA/RNA helicase)